jgi:hypothetical protein
MRLLPVPLLLVLLLFCACGSPRRSGAKAAGEPCTSSEECPVDHACVGCTERDAVCLRGCREDADCAVTACKTVECITCPCPGECAW